MNNFVYDIPVKVYFGENQLGHLGEELRKFGRRVLLTYGGGSIKRIGLYDRVIEELRNRAMNRGWNHPDHVRFGLKQLLKEAANGVHAAEILRYRKETDERKQEHVVDFFLGLHQSHRG